MEAVVERCGYGRLRWSFDHWYCCRSSRLFLGWSTLDLRAVEVWIAERSVRAEFSYDGALRDEHRELVAEVEGLVLGDLPDDVRVDFLAVAAPRRDRPVGIVRDSVYAFLRKE